MTELHWIYSIHHDGSPMYVAGSAARLGATVALRLRTGLDAPVTAISLRTCPDGEQALTPMRQVGKDATSCWWEADLAVTMPRMTYRFLLLTPEATWWLTAIGMVRHTPTDAADFTLLARCDGLAWVRESVFYQIFPDRFADGDAPNNVTTGEYVCYGQPVIARAWGEQPHNTGEAGGVEFFGGDLPGITQRLDYLADLGVNALYLTPIFTAPSNHKYDVVDYMQVDPHFGGDVALVALRQALDARAMRLMLDIVPNHCSIDHPWFRAAQSDPHAETADFFTFTSRPDGYARWLGVRTLAKLNYRSQLLRQRMYAGEDSIMRHWLRPPYRIDAWRMDVANMLARQGGTQLGHKVGRGIRRAVKDEQPQMYLLGEHAFDGTPHLQGDELDASMNYQGFTNPVLSWLGGALVLGGDASASDASPRLPTATLATQWQTYLGAVPWQIALQQFNMLGTHDTPRVLTVLGGDVALLKLGVALLFTFPGVPSVYYGDEIGLEGGRDPDNRRCMIWDSQYWNHDLRQWYQTLIRLRRTSTALRNGGFQLLYAAGDTLAFQRQTPEERLLVVARRGDDHTDAIPVRQAGLPDGARLRDLLTGHETSVQHGQIALGGIAAPGVRVWQQIG